MNERLCRFHRVRHSFEYSRCYRQGSRLHGRVASLYRYRTDHGYARLGITASKKVGNSVERHRAKRRIREIFRRYPNRARLAGWDLVVHLRPHARTSDFDALESDLVRLLDAVSIS